MALHQNYVGAFYGNVGACAYGYAHIGVVTDIVVSEDGWNALLMSGNSQFILEK